MSGTAGAETAAGDPIPSSGPRAGQSSFVCRRLNYLRGLPSPRVVEIEEMAFLEGYLKDERRTKGRVIIGGNA